MARLSLLITLSALQIASSPPAPGLDLWAEGRWQPWRTWQPDAAAVREELLARTIAWRDSADGIRIGDFEVRVSGGAIRNAIAVIEMDPRRLVFRLVATPFTARRTAQSLSNDPSVVFASNTGLFRPDGSPQGLVLIDGMRRSGLAGWLDAVVAIEDGRLALVSIDAARALPPGASAFQVLPWLVQDGRVVLGTTSGIRLSRTHRDRRITLCIGRDGFIRFALSNFEFMGQQAGPVPIGLTIPEQAMIAAALDCRDAVALDGGISAQIAVRARTLHLMRGWRRVPLLLTARRRTI